MAKVTGCKELLHFPMYDAYFVPDPVEGPRENNVQRFYDRPPGDSFLRGRPEQDQIRNQPAGSRGPAESEFLRGPGDAGGGLELTMCRQF